MLSLNKGREWSIFVPELFTIEGMIVIVGFKRHRNRNDVGCLYSDVFLSVSGSGIRNQVFWFSNVAPLQGQLVSSGPFPPTAVAIQNRRTLSLNNPRLAVKWFSARKAVRQDATDVLDNDLHIFLRFHAGICLICYKQLKPIIGRGC